MLKDLGFKSNLKLFINNSLLTKLNLINLYKLKVLIMNQVTTSTLNLLIIDSQVSNWEGLAAGAASDTAVLILDPATDGLTQISHYLNSLSGEQALVSLQSIQIISHGSAGSLTLGSSTVTTDNLSLYTSQLSTIGNALSATGDILLYGCDVAANQTGLDFINQFAVLTSADVAASTDITGSALLGGNWQLEVATGSIESALALPSTTIDNFAGVLAQGNNKPTLTVINNPFATVNEDTEIEITFDQLLTGSNAVDTDGTVAGFSITSLTTGTLRIGADAQSANPWVLGANDLIDITHKAYWTPGLNVNSDNNNENLNAFIVKAIDNDGNNSVGEVQTIIVVTAVNDLPFLNTDPGTLLAGIEDNAYIVSKAALLEGWTDVEGSALNIENLSADNGFVNDNGDGTYTIAPSANFNGLVNLAYEVTDGTGTVSATQSYTLTAVNDAPVFGVAAIATSIGNGFASASSVLVQNNGMIVMGGYSSNGENNDFSLLRYNVDGTLDTDFGAGTGIVASDFFGMGLEEKAYAMAIQPSDGKILLAGTASLGADIGVDTDMVLARYNYDGTLDQSFGYEGVLAVGLLDINGYSKIDECRSISLQSDGKILLAGFSGTDFALIRVNTDGSLDTSFGEWVDAADATLLQTGVLTTDLGGVSAEGFSVTVQADGRILMAGSVNNGFTNDFALVRYNADGSLDNSFDVDGIVTTGLFGVDSQGYSVTLQGDKILLGGYTEDSATGQPEFALVRYNADGSLDTSFGLDGNGIIITDLGYDAKGYSVAIQADGQILLSGFSGSDFAQVRYNGTTGILDAGFGVGGIVTTHLGAYAEGHSVTLQDDGKILLAGISNNGSTTDFTLVRYNSDGSLDKAFDAANATQVSFVENNLPVVLNNTVGVFDAELNAQGSYEGASLTLARELGANSEDMFSGRGNLSFSGTDVIVSNVVVGSVTNSDGTLSITFNANATQIVVDEVVSSIAYLNTNDQPPASVTIDWIFNDNNTLGLQGEGGSLSVVTSTVVNITPVNDAPVLSGVAATLINGIADTSYVVTVSDLLTGYTDPDGDVLTITNLFADHGDVFDNGDGSFTIIPAPTYVGAMVLTYEVFDDIILTPASLSYEVIPCNDGAPLLTGLPVTLSDVAEETPVIVTVAELLQGFTDIDSDQMRVVGLTCDQGEVVLNDDGLSYTITPTLNYFGPVTLSYSVEDFITGVTNYSLTSGQTTLSYIITPVNDAAIITTAVADLIETDTALSLSTTGQLTISDVDSANTFVAQIDVVGQYGVFFLGEDGAWTYDTISAHDEFVAGTTYTDSFIVVSADGTESSVTINILGTNDAAVLSADVNDLTETDAVLSTSGLLIIGDIDSPETFNAQVAVDGNYGVFNLGSDGFWTYDATSAHDEFVDGQLYTDTFSIFSADGTESSVTVNILGTNDAAVIRAVGGGQSNLPFNVMSANVAAVVSAEVVELNETDELLSTSGLLVITDVDSAATFDAQIDVIGTYGMFNLGGDGAWTYNTFTANNEFVGGQYYTDIFSVFSADGTESSVTVNILGTNDKAVLSVDVADLIESNAPLSTTGQLIISDVDSAETFVAQLDVVGTYGVFFLGEDGAWTYDATSAYDEFEEGQLYTDTFSVFSADGTESSVTVNILGTNDAAEFSAEVADLVETDVALGTSGQMLITDVDSPTVFVEQQAVIGQYGVFSIGIDGIWTYDTTSALDEFENGITYTDAFSVFSFDGTESSVTVNILGTNDAPVLTTPDAINYTDTAFVDTFATVTGQLIASDVDSTLLTYGIAGGIDNLNGTISQINEYGELTVNTATGAYTFVADSASIEPLTVDASASFTVTSSDGVLISSQSLVIAIAQDGITESMGDDALTGTVGGDVFNSLAGNDSIDGGLGADSMNGGLGNDRYVVDNSADNVVEVAGIGSGIDSVESSISYGLTANVENLTLTGASVINALGNTLNNVLTGNDTANVLDGRVGADTLIGGLGNDLYAVENSGDQVIESLGSGIDKVNSSISYSLADNVENLTLIGVGVINGFGNTLNNVLRGNDAANVMDGRVGVDTLIGGLGNDLYAVDNNGDKVIENLDGGIDKVNSSISYTLTDNVENLTLVGSASINGTGNDLNNVLLGNSADNILDGGLGYDVLTGGAGSDIFQLLNLSKDKITDFVVGQDHVELASSVFSSLNYTGQLHAENFAIGTKAVDATDYLIYNSVNGVLSYDEDGSGLGAATQIAVLGVNLALTNVDFSMI